MQDLTCWWLFFLTCEDFWGNVHWVIPYLCFLLELEISLHALIPLFRLGSVHSGSVSWDRCWPMFPEELCVSLFPCQNSIVSPFQLCWVKNVGSGGFRCNLPSAFWAEWPEYFICHSHGGRNEQISQHRKLALGKKILLQLLFLIEPMTFWSWVWHYTKWGIPTPSLHTDKAYNLCISGYDFLYILWAGVAMW